MNLLAQILSPVIVFVQVALALFGFQPAKQHQALPAEGPVNILVTGLLGFGENAGLTLASPYFGAQVGELEALSYEIYIPGMGPISSAWDRACELYAEITGTRVDYGEAHSKQCGHERFGRDFSEPLFEGWSKQRPVNLIGHSFGGTTARVFAMLCDEGSAAERAATPKAQRSPLFNGGMLNRINAIVTLSTPHNGTTALVAMPDDYCEADYLWMADALNLIGNSRLFGRFFDLQLDHFDISAPPRAFGQPRDGWYKKSDVRRFLQSKDHAMYDLSLDGAAKINKADKIRPGVKYLSYSASVTEDVLGVQVPLPTGSMNPVLWPFAMQMSLDLGRTPPPGPEWRESDGAVPLPSALYPEGQPHRQAAAKGPVTPGVWNVMPTVYGVDHSFLAGGDPARDTSKELLDIYLDMLERIQ